MQVPINLRTMRVPNTLPSSFGFGLEVTLALIFLCGFSLEFLQFRPAVLEEFRCEVRAVNFCATNISWYIFVWRK